MTIRSKNIFTTVRTEGAILPADLLQRVVDGDKALDGLYPTSYHLLEGEKLNEAINRSWSRLRGAWVSFKAALEKLPPNDPGTSVTRDRLLLPLFQELGYGRLTAAKAIEIENRSYPISHGWLHTPIHLVGWRVDLDRRTAGVAGAARSSPHSLVQELLNRSQEHLWAILSNGRQLRILRDNVSLTRQAYVEFDLEAMMAGEVYADFVLLWLLCHQSRVETEKPEQCWLEKWSKTAQEQGTRALDQLRRGVEVAIATLGQGFLSHPVNRELRQKLQSGQLSTQDYYRQLLRLVYRLLFLFVAEDRGFLLDPKADVAARERYTLYYSTARLRTLAEKRRGTRHADLFFGLRLVMEKLGSSEGCQELGLPALGSLLWSEAFVADVVSCQIANADLLEAIRALAFIRDKHGRRPVDYKNLRSEELGSVYEALLELHPELNVSAGTFALTTAAGNERKTTGSYYTPESLVQCLLDSALDPVVDEAIQQADPEAAILNLKVCDPACGSGHFLIAAAHRMAKRLAAIRTGDEEPSPEATQRALRDVIGRCIYGVDVNPMAVELCKVALWMESLEPGKPLSFLEHHIQCGNSLLGATPALLRKGIPDEAFTPIEGDDKAYCSKYKKQNKQEREKGQLTLLDERNEPWERLGDLATSLVNLNQIADDDIAGVQRKQTQYEEYVKSTPYLFSRFWADAWCAAFVWKKRQSEGLLYPITDEVFRQIERNPFNAPDWMRQEVERLRDQYSFFHWHLAFPNVFQIPLNIDLENKEAGWVGGFDVILGNPPWVRQEVFDLPKNLLSIFRGFKGTADVSVFFVERAITITKTDKLFGLLTPNKWLRADYGESLRQMLREETYIKLLIDFGHSRTLFPDADTFPAACIFQPTQDSPNNETTFLFLEAHDNIREKYGLELLIRQHSLEVSYQQLESSGWRLEDSSVNKLFKKLMATGKPLSKIVDRAIRRGVTTGFNDAFLVNEFTKNRLVADCPKAQHIIHPWVRGADIKRYIVEDSEEFLIFTRRGINIADYPAIEDHLSGWKENLQPKSSSKDKGPGRKPGSYKWFEIQDNTAYYQDFERPKILVPSILYYCEFAYVLEIAYPSNKVNIIPSNNLALLAILNSSVMWWVMNRHFVGMKDGALSVDVAALGELPVPDLSPNLIEILEIWVTKILEEKKKVNPSNQIILLSEMIINFLSFKAYNLSLEDQQLINETIPRRDPLIVALNKTTEQEKALAKEAFTQVIETIGI